MSIVENVVWTEKYRPKKVEDCIVPLYLKEMFSGWVAKGFVPNCIMSGTPGIGKTSVAKAVLDELGFDWLLINGSLKGNIDTLRNEISNFASSVSFAGKRKYVLIDEADYLNQNSTQPALRNFIEEYSRNCGFILTCNFPSKIMEPLRSRLAGVEFKVPKDEAPKLAQAFFTRAAEICKKEGVEVDRGYAVSLVKTHFPDFRKVLNELQKGTTGGRNASASISDLIGYLKTKNFGEMRRWVAENPEVEPHDLFRSLYVELAKLVRPESVPQLVLTTNKYDYQAAFVSDHELNTAACLTELMADMRWT